MTDLSQATLAALELLVSGDNALWMIVAVSLKVSISAIAIALIPALWLAFILAYGRFYGRTFLLSLFRTLQALPTVVIGLILYLLFSHAGPLGDWQLLFTQKAMIIGQLCLCLPVLVTLSQAAFAATDRRALETAQTLGAPWYRIWSVVAWDARLALASATTCAFARIITEVGSSMMVGGNILNMTRNIPTAIALETSRGLFIQGIALGIVLLILALGLNFILSLCQSTAQPISS